MVIGGYVQKRSSAEYSLNRVIELAQSQSIRYASTKVQNDIANLEYGVDDVCECLSSLTDKHFINAEKYPESPRWMDVYLIKWRLSGNDYDELYIKLSLDHNCLVIELRSFHLTR
jgi:hypothetical protein